MSRTAVIIQPCFFPWRGQFDLISRSDVTIFLDTVQFVRRRWYNRNRIMTAHGPQWITVPVATKGEYTSPIGEIRIADHMNWRAKILGTLRHAYGRAPYFDTVFPAVEDLLERPWTHLAPLAQETVNWGCGMLCCEREFVTASALQVAAEDPEERLVHLCRAVGADRYLSGPVARDYMEEGAAFADAGIALDWMTYCYPAYPQVRPCTDPPLSVLDLLFNVGGEAPRYIWGTKPHGCRTD